MSRLKKISFFHAQALLILLFSALYIQAQNTQTIGRFDINKVRELSQGSEPTLPSAGAAAQASAPKDQPNYTLIIIRIAVSLALIIALIFGVSWLMRKSGLMGSSRAGGGGSMDVLEVLPLGQNRNVVMFRVADRVYVCGQTPSSVTLLDRIDGQAAANLLTSSKGPSTVVQFKDAFNQFMGKRKK